MGGVRGRRGGGGGVDKGVAAAAALIVRRRRRRHGGLITAAAAIAVDVQQQRWRPRLRGRRDRAVAHCRLSVGCADGGGVVVEEGPVHGVKVAAIAEEALHVTAAERRDRRDLIALSQGTTVGQSGTLTTMMDHGGLAHSVAPRRLD